MMMSGLSSKVSILKCCPLLVVVFSLLHTLLREDLFSPNSRGSGLSGNWWHGSYFYRIEQCLVF